MRWYLADLLWRAFMAVLPSDNPQHHVAAAGIEYFRHHRTEFPEYDGNVWHARGVECLMHGNR